jgi:hypothetical protein
MSRTVVFFIAIAVIAIAGGGYWYITQTKQVNTACTQEAKLCPDGSYVGRTGPDCEFAACPTAPTAPSATSTDSGIRGKVTLGPTCPVERIPPDPNCADRPYQTLVAIFHASDPVHAIVLTHSDASGTFSASLPPGEYTLGAGESDLPRCDHPQVTVAPQTFTTTTISCDTGIR